jgi:polyisoprenyl-teichoic acid--peptidoglycan teichoic acid transferase
MSVTTTPPPAPPAPPTRVGPPRIPPPEPPPEPPRAWIVWRVVLGCLAVLLCAGVTSAVFWSGQVGTLKRALNLNPTLQVGGGLTPASFGGPENLLLVGNDQRKRTTTTPVLPHANEMLVVRFDPGKPYISMMSIPRELMATINCPNGPTTTRLNYALTCGGVPTLVATIKQLTGLSINHVVEIDFGQFKRAVNDMGCVYSTVDRRYYHVNVPGGEQYQEINLKPGYQRMCGGDALSFVSYRHGDTSLARDARDQSFLLDVKREYGPTLVDNADKFEQIFGRSVETDPGLHTTGGILDLVGTLVNSSSLRVRQVQFQVNLQPTGANPCSCDTATTQQVGASVNAFLYGGSGLPPKKKVAAVAGAVHAHRARSLPLVPISSEELSKAVNGAAAIPFPLEIPRVKDKNGSNTPVSLRTYPIQAPDGSQYASYVAVFQAGGPGQYYDVQGTTWTTAPFLDNPDQTVKVGSRTYYLDYEGQHLVTVAWYEHGAVYWVRNSLTDALGNGELLAIAEQTAPATAHVGSELGLRAAVVPQRIVTQPEYDLKNTLGSVGGLVALLALPLLAIPFFHRRRELGKLRAQLAATLHFESQLRAAAPGTGPATAQTGWSAAVFTVPRLSRRMRMLVGAGALVLAAVGAAGILVNLQGGTTPKQVTHTVVQTTPSVPVAVLNASKTPGAAGKLAKQLRGHGVKLATVGDLNGSHPPGLLILYAPGYRSQAEVLAHVMAARRPTIQPINPAAQAAAGSKTRLALVIA